MSIVRRAWLVPCLVALFSLAPADADEPASPPATAASVDTLIEQGEEAWLRRDPNGALRAFDAAVSADPKSATVLIRRANFLEEVSSLVKDKAQGEQLAARAKEDLAAAIRLDPDTPAAGFARDSLHRMAGKHGVPAVDVTCPPEAVEAHGEADRLFQAGHYDEALRKSQLAADACPASAAIWSAFADTYYFRREYGMAKALFTRAIEADPWYRVAHGFLADTETKLGNTGAALHEAALAVICDPSKEATWAMLRRKANDAKRSWRRVYSDRVDVEERGKDESGKNRIDVKVPDGLLGKSGNASDSNTSAAWLAYAMHKAGVIGRTFDLDGKKLEGASKESFTATPFEIERSSARLALKVLGELPDGKAVAGYWAMLRAAESAGFLDEAVFLHLFDDTLVPEYLEFRKTHRDRLVQYVETLLVPAQDPDRGSRN